MRIKVEMFSVPGCSKCAAAKEALKSVVADVGPDTIAWRDVDILEEMDYATKLGVMSSGAIAIDGKLVYPGLPSAEKLREELIRRAAVKEQKPLGSGVGSKAEAHIRSPRKSEPPHE